MIKRIENPNVPSGRVFEVIIGEKYKDTISALEKVGIKCLSVACCTNVHPFLECHTDLQFCHVDENTVFLSNYQDKLKNEMMQRGFKCFEINDNLSANYPNDVLLNSVVIGKYVICNVHTIDKNLLTFFEENNFILIHVKQGYTKCSTVVISNSAIITDDEAIGLKAQENGIDSLIVSKGSVKLDDFNYGFIGGCCGMISNKTLAVNGNLKYHTDFESICAFTFKHGVKILNLFDKPLEDIGSIIPITEDI